MSQEPIDFEAERRRAAKELGLPYSDLDDPVHSQRNMQTQEAKKELAEMLLRERHEDTEPRTTRRRVDVCLVQLDLHPGSYCAGRT